VKNSSIRLQSLTLYSVKSYLPSTDATPQLSGSFFMGYRHFLNSNLKQHGAVEISGAIGKTYRLHRDLMVYGMFGLGLAGNNSDAFLYAEPHAGAIFNLVGDSKAILEYRIALGQFESRAVTHTSIFKYAWYGLKNTTVKLSVTSVASKELRRNEFAIGVDYHF
jgi:hypothetical protein